MGVLTDLFIATDSQMQQLGDHDIPLHMYPVIDIKGVDHIKLATLQCLVMGRAYDISIIDEFDLVHERSEDGPWVYGLPEPLVDGLVALDIHEISQVAEAWAATDEVRLDNWPRSAVEAVLRRIVELVKQAQVEGKEVFMWICL